MNHLIDVTFYRDPTEEVEILETPVVSVSDLPNIAPIFIIELEK